MKFFLVLIIFSIFLSCGIKSKPLPPIETATQEIEPAQPVQKKK